VNAQTTARRLLDLFVASTALVALSPLLALVALAIRLESPGPVIFRQRRLGQGLRPFTVLKFRTMRHGADAAVHREYVHSLIGQPPTGEPPTGRPVTGRPVTGRPDTGEPASGQRARGQRVAGERGELYKLSVDSRITRVGRFLRSWSLDELPQLVNVLRGEMALVGPRPVIPYEVERYPERYLPRFTVKPGLTGLWQVSGRNERTYEEMVRFDIEYARHASLLLDLRILARTVPVVFGRQGVA
jgi:lipopolysaccharide/colanic/teichoic acid biosynthesis glycosyltransferase